MAITNLHLEVTGDCSGAVAALGNTQAAIDHLSGQTAGISASLSGSDNVIRDLGRIGDLRDAITSAPPATVGLDASAIAAARGEMRGLGADVRGATSDFRDATGAIGGIGSGIGGGGAFRQLASDLGEVTQGMGAVGSAAEEAEPKASRFSQWMSSQLSKNALVAQALYDGADATSVLGGNAAEAVAPVRELAMAGSAVSESSSGAVQRTGQLATNLSGIGKSAGDAAQGMREVTSANSVMNDEFHDITSRLGPMGTDGGPPKPPRGGGGGGGGGGGFGDLFGGEGSSGGKGESGSIGALGAPLMMGAMVGLAADAVTAAVGVAGVAEVVKQTPGLMRAASAATREFDKGIRSAAGGALSEGEPAFKALGKALEPLGHELGQIGTEQMTNVLGGATTLAGGLTTALGKIEPSIGPAIQGLTSLGSALLEGVSSPAAVAGINAVSKVLSDPDTEKGIETLTSGLVSVAGVATSVVGSITGTIGSLTGSSGASPQVQSDVMAGGVGAWLGRTLLGGKAGMLAGAGTMAIANNQEQQGTDPSTGIMSSLMGSYLGKSLATSAFGAKAGPIGMLAGWGGGELLGAGAQALDQDVDSSKWGSGFQNILKATEAGAGVGAMAGGPVGAGIGAITAGVPAALQALWNVRPGAPSQPGGASDAQTGFPSGQPGKYGYDLDQQGKATPSTSATSGGGYALPQPTIPSLGLGDGPTPAQPGLHSPPPGWQPTQLPAAAPPSPAASRAEERLPQPNQLLGMGPGSSVAPMPTSAAQQLNQAMQQTQQVANQAAPPLQNYGQSAVTAANRVQQLGQNSTQTFQSLNQASSSATSQLSSASSSINEGSQALGSSVPQSMADGVNSNVGVACDATANLGAAAKNCGASALQAASPSKAFIELGVGISDGLAIGVNSSAGTATSAVSQAMASVVSAGQAGLAAASPSKTFQNLGQQIVGQPNIGQIQQQATQQVQAAQQAAQQAMQRAQSQAPFASDNALYGKQQQQRQDASLQNLPKDIQDRIKSGQPLTHDEKTALSDQQKMTQFNQGLQHMGYGQSGVEAADAREQRDLNDGHAAYKRLNTAWGGDPNETPHQKAIDLAKHPTGDAEKAMNDQGRSGAGEFAKGLAGGQGEAGKAGEGLGDSAVSGTRKKLKSSSPSQVMMGIGQDVSAGLAIGIASSADGVATIASNSGLMVGYVYGESVTTGALSVIQSSQFQTAAVSGVGSQLAEAVLGSLNMLGPAPAGGEIYKNSAVTMNNSTPAAQPIVLQATIQNVMNMDGTPIALIAGQQVQAQLEGLTNTLQLQ